MIPIELLLAPLNALITAMGTGVLPGGAPAAQLRSTGAVLDDARATQHRLNSELEPQWTGAGGSQALATLDKAVRDTVPHSDNRNDIDALINTAADKVLLASDAPQSYPDT